MFFVSPLDKFWGLVAVALESVCQKRPKVDKEGKPGSETLCVHEETQKHTLAPNRATVLQVSLLD